MAEKYQSSIRMDKRLGERLKLVSQVTGHSVNKLIEAAVMESMIGYESDPEFQVERTNWLRTMDEMGA